MFSKYSPSYTLKLYIPVDEGTHALPLISQVFQQ